MASGFGYRTDPFTKARKCMNGFYSQTGTPIYATGDGVVAKADNTASGWKSYCDSAWIWIRNIIRI
jgi:murein DD-endopeptidase MepM/ murein hydrolase activator NlpD